MKNRKILKRGLALLCAATILVGGFAILATNSKAETVAEQLAADGYTKMTPATFEITEELVYTYESSQIWENHTASSVTSFDKKYLEADISITNHKGIENRIAYMGKWNIFIYVGWDEFRIYSNQSTTKPIYQKSMSSLDAAAGEYFNIKIATDVSKNASDSKKTDITLKVWVNDNLVRPLSTVSSTESVTITVPTSQVTKSLGAFLDKTGTIKIKEHVEEVETPEIPDTLEGYTAMTPENFGITGEVVHSGASISQAYTATDITSFHERYLDADISFASGQGLDDAAICYMGEEMFRMYIASNKFYVYDYQNSKNLYETDISDLSISEGEYFYLQWATSIRVNSSDPTKSDVTMKIMVNDAVVAPLSTVSDTTSVTVTVSTAAIAQSMTVLTSDTSTATIKIRPAGWDTTDIPDDLEGYEAMTPATFNIAEELVCTLETDAVIGADIWKPYTASDVTSFDNKYLEADIAITNVDSNYENRICYMGGEMFFIYVGWNHLKIYDYQHKTTLYESSLTGLNITSGEYFAIKIATNLNESADGTKTNVTMKVWVNDEVLAPLSTVSDTTSVTVSVDTTALSNTLTVAMTKAGTIKIKEHSDDTPVEGVDPNLPDALKAYDRITLPEHFGIEAAEDEVGTTHSSTKSKVFIGETLHKTYLEVDVHFNGNTGGTYMQYMHENDWDKYARVIHYGSGLSVFEGNNDSNKIWTTVPQNNEFFNLKLAVDMVTNETDATKSDISLQVWVNNVLQGTLKFTATTAEANRCYIYATSTAKLTLRTPLYKTETPEEPDEPIDDTVTTLSDVTYELSSGAGYLLTGSGTLYVDDVERATGTALQTPGDYVIKRVKSSGATYIQNVSLYKVGDVNLGGGEEWTADDRADIERIIAGKITSAAAMKAADINNDGKVSKSDLELMKKVIKGELDKDAVIKKYHAPAVTYDFLGGDSVMPIGGYYGPYNESTVTNGIYKAIANSGVNLIVSSNMDYSNTQKQELIKQGLAYAEKYGIGVFVSDARLNPITMDENKLVTEHSYVSSATELATLLGDYSTYNSFLGNMIVDEPIANIADGWAAWEADLVSRFKWYEDITTVLNAYDNQMGYVNLLGQYHMQKEDGSTVYMDYETYIRAIGKSTKLLSFDSYPFWKKTGASGGLQPYLESLGTISKVAREDGYPFWSYIQAGTDFRDDGATGESDEPLTEAQTLWNVNTSLAFGAKGIVYFPLLQPSHFANVSDGTYDYNRNGIIGANNEINNQYTDSDGNAYGYYTWVQKANKQVDAVDEVLMKALNQGVLVTGQAADDAADVDSVHTSMDTLTAIEGLTEVSGDDAMVGCFTYGDAEAFYVVSYDYATTETQSIELSFNGNRQYRIIQGGATTYGEGKTCTITASAGEGVLIVLEDRIVYYDDISPYRTEGAYTAPEAPAGYIFAGWFKDESCTKEKAVGQNVTEGAAYAKFVDAKLLTVKAQITAGTTADSENASIRFVTSVDTLNYRKVAFLIRIHKDSGIEERDRGDNVVYKELTAMIGDTVWKYKPQNLFCSSAKYFKAWIINKIPKANFDTKFEVTPYWTTLDGTIVYGTTAIKTVRQGIK